MRGQYSAYGQRSGGGVVFVLFLVGVILTICLYFVKMRAQTAKAEAAQLEQIVRSEEIAIKVLKAELAHLESPSRLSELSSKKLELSPIQASQMIIAKDIVEIFPLRVAETEVQP